MRCRRASGCAATGDEPDPPAAGAIPAAAPFDTALASSIAIAVLPFRGATEEPQEADAGRGVAEGLVRMLARTNTAPVVPASTTWAYSREDRSLARAGRDLGARFLVEGRVRITGGR